MDFFHLHVDLFFSALDTGEPLNVGLVKISYIKLHKKKLAERDRTT